MYFSHEKLDVYKAALQFMAMIDQLTKAATSAPHWIRDQLSRAAGSIVLNIAEGNGKRTGPDRRRFFEIARGSAMECAGALDILVVCGSCLAQEVDGAKALLLRVVSMLSRMTQTNTGTVREPQADYGSNSTAEYEYEYDNENENGREAGGPEA